MGPVLEVALDYNPLRYHPLFKVHKWGTGMKANKWVVFLATCLVNCFLFAEDAQAKVARCDVSDSSGGSYKGPCEFSAFEKGSFSIDPLIKGKKILGATIVSVWIVEPGVAEVRGLTPHGLNSRWGEARRSTSNKACWLGSDFKICVY